VLFYGAGYSTYFARTAYLTLEEGMRRDEAVRNDSWEIAMWEGRRTPSSREDITTRALEELQEGSRITCNGCRLRCTVQEVYTHCTARLDTSGTPDARRQSGHIEALVPRDAPADPAKKTPGVVLHVMPGDRYVRLHSQTLSRVALYSGGGFVMCELRRTRIPLPVSVTLKDFEKKVYPGTDKARSFESTIHVSGPDIDRDAVIAMNRPFRYGRYTFFQSSYSHSGERQSSTFAVVKNAGKYLPYIASIMMIAGLLVHFIMVFIYTTIQRKSS
jgi:hypothetical protein